MYWGYASDVSCFVRKKRVKNDITSKWNIPRRMVAGG